jgi:hypothetical protein
MKERNRRSHRQNHIIQSCRPGRREGRVPQICLGDAGKRALLALYNFIYAHQLCPTDWTKDVAWPIHKKGDVTGPGNYRLITLMSVTCKLFERLLNTRLTAWTTSDA